MKSLAGTVITTNKMPDTNTLRNKLWKPFSESLFKLDKVDTKEKKNYKKTTDV